MLPVAFTTTTLFILAACGNTDSDGGDDVGGADNEETQGEDEESTVEADTANIENSEWDKIFPQSDEVTHEKVTFDNRLGIELAADMYVPEDIDTSEELPAIIVGHPFGGVKEQTSGLHAQELAERGFVTIAFDASYNGESGGEPRNIASPEAFTEDFSAAVDFLGTNDLVDQDRIGVLGVCGSGGFAINAAQADPRLQAVATTSLYDMGRANREGLGLAPVPDEVMTDEERMLALEEAAEQRWIEAEGGEPIQNLVGDAVELNPSHEAAADEFAEYYETSRGEHPRALPMSLTSRGALMNFFPFEQIETISPRPMLFIAGEDAHSRHYSEDAYELAGEESELHIVPEAGHVDLYDDMDLIPFDELESFFQENI
ncbi:alpha/beta hydrolase [Salicibibacter halophilus]|uniref:Alpha/beta hydrolase n=1 Tax=Salicibibacter halophilus TaxID=2502791 RepID=A0A514LHL6_9BACI|nr:alpha/beta hydrolase [Salicibibacter halophilus]QDI91337.1 alpha/beta hydrolase [Salicibibacter halophilus]